MTSALFAILCCASTLLAEPTPPRPLAGNVVPEYPQRALKASIAGTVTFRADVSADGAVTAVSILRVPIAGYGFETATSRAVMQWRFEPGREVDGRSVAMPFIGATRFALRAEDEDEIAAVVHRAYEIWRPFPGRKERDTKKAPTIKVQGREFTPTSSFEARLTESFGSTRDSAESLSLDVVQFEGDDAWAKTSLRLVNSTDEPEDFWTLMVRRHGHWFGYLSEIPKGRYLPEGPQLSEPSRDVDPQPVFTPPPPLYPYLAMKKGVSGDAVLKILVEPDGSTTILQVLARLPYCNVAAIDNAWKWRWKPATRDGKQVRAVGTISVNFAFSAHRSR
jgi:TonB family protein